MVFSWFFHGFFIFVMFYLQVTPHPPLSLCAFSLCADMASPIRQPSDVVVNGVVKVWQEPGSESQPGPEAGARPLADCNSPMLLKTDSVSAPRRSPKSRVRCTLSCPV